MPVSPGQPCVAWQQLAGVWQVSGLWSAPLAQLAGGFSRQTSVGEMHSQPGGPQEN